MANYKRTALPLFELKNAAYTNATITFYEVDGATGARTDTLATLYDAYAGGAVVSNPYQLDSNGMADVPLYYDRPIVVQINNSGVGEHSSGIIFPESGNYRDVWASGVYYLAGDFIKDGANGLNTGSIYVCSIEHESGTWEVDLSANKWDLIVNAEAATEASTSATAAAASAAAAATSASSAATQASASYSFAEESHGWAVDSETYADNSQTSANASAASAASAAASAASLISIAGFKYKWSTNTSASDPSTGYIKANNASLASATALYISETTDVAQNIAAEIATWDDSSSSIKGKLKLIKASDPTSFAIYNVTGTLTDSGTWDTLTVSYVSGAGSFSNGDAIYAQYLRTGDAAAPWSWADDDGTAPSVAPSATGTSSLALGSASVASGNHSVAFGTNTDSTGLSSVAIGGSGTDSASADALADYAVAIGNAEVGVSGYGSVALGMDSYVADQYSLAISGANVQANNAIGIGVNSIVPIGANNSIAIGRYSRTRLPGQINLNADTSNTGTYYSIYKMLTFTADATPIVMNLSAGGSLEIPSDSTFGFKAFVTARRSDANNESAFYELSGCIDNNAGTTALVGTVTKSVHAEDNAAWDVNITANNVTDALDITCTGEAAKMINWLAIIHMYEVTG